MRAGVDVSALRRQCVGRRAWAYRSGGRCWSSGGVQRLCVAREEVLNGGVVARLLFSPWEVQGHEGCGIRLSPR